MAKQNTLPSISEQSKPDPMPIIQGYKTRMVTTQLKGANRDKFKTITRFLDDTQATLKDGSLVSDKKCRVVLWLIENFELPRE